MENKEMIENILLKNYSNFSPCTSPDTQCYPFVSLRLKGRRHFDCVTYHCMNVVIIMVVSIVRKKGNRWQAWEPHSTYSDRNGVFSRGPDNDFVTGLLVFLRTHRLPQKTWSEMSTLHTYIGTFKVSRSFRFSLSQP